MLTLPLRGQWGSDQSTLAFRSVTIPQPLVPFPPSSSPVPPCSHTSSLLHLPAETLGCVGNGRQGARF